jgi:Sulfotransferase family
MTNPFVFLFGCPRSGTSLLNRMVAAHRQIAMAKRMPKLVQKFEDRDGLTADGMVTPEFIHALLERGRFGRTRLTPNMRQDLVSLLDSSREVSYPELISRIFDRVAEDRGKPLAGTKTNKLVPGIRTAHQLWPDAKFVHIIRDGRDLCLSAIQWRRAATLAEHYATWNQEAVSTAALWWEWNVRMVCEAGSSLASGSYYEIRYESFVAHPADECSALCDFLGVPFDEAMLRFNEGKERTEPGLSAKHAWLPPTPGLRDWRTQMPAEDIERFEAVAGDLLSELGYDRGTDVTSNESLQYAARLRELFEERPRPQRWNLDLVGNSM